MKRSQLVVAEFGMVAHKLLRKMAALDVLDGYTVTAIGEEPYSAYS